MSLTVQIRYQVRSFIQFLLGFTWPSFMENASTKTVVALIVGALMVGYVFETNAIATRGYVVHNLEEQVAALQNDTEKIQTQIASYQSMNSIQKRLVKDEYVSAAVTKFIHVSNETSVAQK